MGNGYTYVCMISRSTIRSVDYTLVRYRSYATLTKCHPGQHFRAIATWFTRRNQFL